MHNNDPRPKPGWYVIQVSTGSEQRMCRAIERACAEHDDAAESDDSRVGLKECFSPRFASRKKRKGQWYDVERALLPGYVIADVRNPMMLAHALHSVNAFCRVLSSDETYVPFDSYEQEWIEAYTSKGERVVPMSFGHRENDSVKIVNGPLRGQEARITRIDRSNCMAHLEFHVGPIRIKTTVGLGILPKQ